MLDTFISSTKVIECSYLVSVWWVIGWYPALDKTIAPLSNASASLAFKKDFILGASLISYLI